MAGVAGAVFLVVVVNNNNSNNNNNNNNNNNEGFTEGLAKVLQSIRIS